MNTFEDDRCIEDKVKAVGDVDLYNYIKFLESRLSEFESSNPLKPYENNYKKRDAVEEIMDDQNVEHNTTLLKKLDILACMGDILKTL